MSILSRIAVVHCFVLAFACTSGSKKGETAASVTTSPATNTSDLSIATFSSVDQYLSYAQEAEGFLLGGESVKFFIDLHTEPKVYFINGNYQGLCRYAKGQACAVYHYDFALERLMAPGTLDEFNKATYLTADRRFAVGTLTRYKLDGRNEVFAIQLSPSDTAKDAILLNIAKILRNSLPAPIFPLSIVPTGNAQTTALVADDLAAIGIEVLSIDTILGSTNFRAMHPGEAWGYIRLFPPNQDDLTPNDIVVFDELPLDLTVVAGVITKAFQDTNSHINLKSKERDTPNMILRNAGPESSDLAPWIDKPVYLKITRSAWSIEATTPEVIQKRFQERQAKPWMAMEWTASDSILNYKAMCPNSPTTCLDLGKVYGSKAANLGFLKEVFKNRMVPRSAELTYDPVPEGFGVPLQFYREFLDLPSNSAVKAKVEELIAKEKSGQMSVSERTALALQVREMILSAELPGDKLQAVLAAMAEINPALVKWKIRSSANAEDIANFDGAGLHDSYSSKTTTKDNAQHTCELVLDEEPDAEGELIKFKVKPKSVACAIKGVYASLWNRRAIDERSFARIDHASVAMGLSILPSYDTESPIAANSVVLTRVVNSPEIWGYTLSIQKGNNTVTNPSPGSWSEVTVTRPVGLDETSLTLSTLRLAKPTAASDVLKGPVLPAETTFLMGLLARKVEEAYCEAKEGYFQRSCASVAVDRLKKKALDLEMKYLENGQFVIKQVREFSGH
jgi:hypothetical protein